MPESSIQIETARSAVIEAARAVREHSTHGDLGFELARALKDLRESVDELQSLEVATAVELIHEQDHVPQLVHWSGNSTRVALKRIEMAHGIRHHWES